MILRTLAMLAVFAAGVAQAAVPGFVRVAGRGFVGPDGAPFLVRGISLGNWLVPEGYMFKFKRALSPREIDAVFARVLGRAGADAFWRDLRDGYVTRDDIDFIAASGFNTVRVPLHYALFMREDAAGRPVFEGPGYALIDRLVGWCRQAGLRVLLDLHAAPGGQTGVNHDDGTGFPLVFYVPKYRDETIALWRHLAERYADEPAVLGYDLLNEPISPYNDEDLLNPRLEPLYRDIVAAVRQVDTRHPVFLAAGQWSTNFSVFGPPFAPNVAYTYHKFWASTRRDSVQDYVDFSMRWNVPILLGEAGELTDKWNTAFRTLNEKFGIGWSFWTYKEPESSSTVVSVQLPAGWADIAAVGSAETLDAAPAVPVERARAVVAAYMRAIRLKAARVNGSYLRSLGLSVPPVPGSAVGRLEAPRAAAAGKS